MGMNVKCTNCGADASGKFCASCGAPLAGAACGNCRAPLTPGAKFCHRCGSPAGASSAGSSAVSSGVAPALPWAVAAIALVALIAMIAGQRFARAPRAGGTLTTPAGVPIAEGQAPGGTRAPDISQLTPAERAERLYDRIMGAAERGRVDTVRFFMPMALQAYEALGQLNTDQRYDLGRLAEVAGDARIAGAQADTILRGNAQHLLGLVLASRAARLRGDERASLQFLQRLARADSTERARQLPEYLLHAADIDLALAELRQRSTKTGGR